MSGTKKKLFFHAFPPQKTVKSSSDGRARHHNRSGVVELVGREPLMFAKVENGVTKSCQFFRRKNKKNAIWILAWVFPLFWAGSFVARESRHLRDRTSTNTAKKKKNSFWFFEIFFQWPAHPVFSGKFSFFWRCVEIIFFFWGGGGRKLASQWPSWGMYKHVPPVFGATDVCYIEKKAAK